MLENKEDIPEVAVIQLEPDAQALIENTESVVHQTYEDLEDIGKAVDDIKKDVEDLKKFRRDLENFKREVKKEIEQEIRKQIKPLENKLDKLLTTKPKVIYIDIEWLKVFKLGWVKRLFKK